MSERGLAGRTLWSIAVVLLAAVTATAQSDADDEDAHELILPPGYELPEVPDPRPDPWDRAAHEPDLVFAGPDRIVHKLNLDPTPRGWLGPLLTLRIGDTEPPRQSDRYRVFPLGLAGMGPGVGSGRRALALLDEWLIVFEGTLAANPDATLVAVNDEAITLALDGTDVVITDARYVWRFAWEPERGDWRLARLELRRRPGKAIELVYEDDRLIELHLPNDQQVELTYREGLLERIQAPFGQETSFDHDRHGRVTRLVRSVRPDNSQTPPFRKASYRYDYDEQGRLNVFTDAHSNRWTCSYDTRSEGEATHVLRAQSRADNSYLFQHYAIAGNGHHQRTIGAGQRGQSLEDAMEAYAFAAVQAQPQALEPFESLEPGHPHWLRSTFDDEAALLRYRLSTLAWQRVQPLIEPEPEIELERDEAGRVTVREDPYGPTMRYDYSDSGDLLQAHIEGEGEPHRFTTDNWGRIVQHERPDGSMREWEFDELGRVTMVRDGAPVPGDPDDVLAEQRFRWDETQFIYHRSGNLTEIERPDGRRERFVYDSRGQLTMHRTPSGRQWRYRHDRQGRPIRIDTPDRSSEEFAFYADGRLAEHQRRPRNDDPRTTRDFDPQGRIIAEDVQGLGRSQYEYDARGRRYRTVHPDGTDTVYKFDDYGRIVEIRGSHQPPVDIRYDEQGNREVIPVRQ